jgi:hypothetical protein
MKLSDANIELYQPLGDVQPIDEIEIEHAVNPRTGAKALFLVLRSASRELVSIRLSDPSGMWLHERLDVALKNPTCSHPESRRDPNCSVQTTDAGERVCNHCGARFYRHDDDRQRHKTV